MAALCLLALASAHAAEGEDEPAPAPAESSAGPAEEVIVTTQRREQELTDVPLSVSVLSGERIEEADIHELHGIASRTPSHNHAQHSHGQHIVTIRGANSNDDGAGTDSSVALFLDDVYLGRSSNIGMELSDLERIEVLRGPQGTLYGKNTVGGAINIITRRPSIDESYGSLKLSLGNYDLRLLAGDFSTPLADSWAVKVSGSSRVRDGWVDNVLRPNDNLKNENAGVGRIQTLYQGLQTSVLFSADANYLDVDDMARIPIADGQGEAKALTSYLEDTGLAEYNHRRSSSPTDGFAKRNAGGLSLRLDHHYNDTDSLTYILAWRRSHLDWEMDMVGSSALAILNNIDDKTGQSQNELRISLDRSSWSTAVGLWWSTEQTTRTESFDRAEGSDHYTQDNTTISLAAYGQTEARLGRAFYLVMGARLTNDRKKITTVSVDGTSGLPCPPATPACTPGSYDLPFIINTDFNSGKSESWIGFTPKLTLGLRLGQDRNHNLYLDYATGFKSGGFAAAPTEPEHLNPLRPETATSIELGYKTSIHQHSGLHLRVGLAYFLSLYQDLQIQQFGRAILDDGALSEFGYFRTINASDAVATGLEFEVHLRTSDYFFIAANGSIVDSSYEDTRPLHTGARYDGKRLLHLADNKISIHLGGDLPARGGNIFRWGLDWRYESETLHDLSDDRAVSPAYSLLDIRLAWLLPAGIEVAAWLRNALDESWIHHIYVIGPGAIAVFGDPLTYGATIKYVF